MNKLLEMLSPAFVLRNSLYGSVLLGACVPLVGVFLVIGRRTILALALPQVSTLGVAAAVWLLTFCGVRLHRGDSPLPIVAMFGGAIAAMAAVLLWQFVLEKRVTRPEDADLGATYAVASGLTLALAASNFVPELGLLDTLRGEVLALPSLLLWVECAGFACIGVVLLAFACPLQSVLYDRTQAWASGLPVDFLGGLTTAVIAVTIALGGLCAGPLTVFAFLVLPSVAMLPHVRHLKTLYVCSALTGIVCAFGGFWISYAIEDWTLPIPAAQIALLGLVWLVSRLLSLARG